MIGTELIRKFVAGGWHDPISNRAVACPVRAIEIAPTLDGREAELVRHAGLGGRLAIIADETTHEVMGRRVAHALRGSMSVVLDRPKADDATAAILAERTRHAVALIAVGSGTLNDLCKYVSFQSGRACAVFATAPSMNGYPTRTASLTIGGNKLSLPCRFPTACFFDLDVLARAPARMIRAGIGDALCRSTAQVDWLLSHRLFGTAYAPGAFALQAADEPIMLARARDAVAGDPDAVAAVTVMLILSGLATVFTGSSHAGSMGEHAISHYIDLFADPHPGSLHGEQVGVATLTMARLQTELFANDMPPLLQPTLIDRSAMSQRHGSLYDEMHKSFLKKALDATQAGRLNEVLRAGWTALRHEMSNLMLPLAQLEAVMRAAGLAMSGGQLGLEPAFYRTAVRCAREIRDRWSVLDLAADAGLLDDFVAKES